MAEKAHREVVMARESSSSSVSSNGRRVRRQGSELLIEFPYDAAVVDAVRTIPKREWNKEAKHWTCRLEYLPEVIDTLSPHGFGIPQDLVDRLDSIKSVRRKAERREEQKAHRERCAEAAFRESSEEKAFVPSHDASLTRRIKNAGVYERVTEETSFGSTVIGYEVPDRIVIEALTEKGHAADRKGRLVELLRYMFKINAEAKQGRPYFSAAVTRYGKKEHLLREACRLATEQDWFTWGWKMDPDPPPNGAEWVLYFEAEGKQVSFHTFDRGDGPDFPGEWNGVINEEFPWKREFATKHL